MADLKRRDFLKILGLAGTTTAVGCSSDTVRRLIPYVTAPEDVIPGKAEWYASTCRECPAGCGLLAKNRDGHIIKVEGNPLHPVSGGKLCQRGQTSLHGLYNPDRFRGPMTKNAQGKLEPIPWDKAEEIFLQKVNEIVKQGKSDRIVFMTGLTTGTMKDVIGRWVSETGSPNGHVIYEPFSYEPLRKANQTVFGKDSIPWYRIDRADFLISFNAGFLETWLSNVEYARQFASFRTYENGRKNPFVYVGPRLSMTAANADLWITVAPGQEYLIALGMLRAILDENLPTALTPEQTKAVAAMAEKWPLEKVSAETGVDAGLIRTLARRFSQAERPLALAEGLSFAAANATDTAVAVNLLCALSAGSRQTMDFSRPSCYGEVAKTETIQAISERMKRGEVDLLIVHEANPVFSLPLSWDFQASMKAVPMVVSCSSAIDETSALANLVLPTHTPLESWGDYSPRPGVTGLTQPVMGLLFDSRHLGDLLIASGKKIKGQEKFPWKDFYDALQESWSGKRRAAGAKLSDEAFWEAAVERGGLWDDSSPEAPGFSLQPSPYPFADPGPPLKAGEAFYFTAYPTVQFFDGRQANRAWSQEIPDPITQTTHGGWVEIHPDTARELGIEEGDVLRLKSPDGELEAPALPIPTVPRNVAAMPMGQGHTSYGRYAEGRPANVMRLFPPGVDPVSGGMHRPPFPVTITKTGAKFEIAHTDGSYTQHGRDFFHDIPLDDYKKALAASAKPDLILPLPEGYDPRKDFYPPHLHENYRWCMVVDLDRCIGCAACVVACYAENNCALVGREQVLRGREMSWLRVQRYFEEDERKPFPRWLPMLCQHCDNAPCESVCPVYAPHHSKEGLNNQVYNRCIGTRFCSQNDPYKVRRFNWFTFTREDTLKWQLNPDVLVRQKGIMEKCSFCVHRIVDAKIHARNEGRMVKDGEFTTACAQTCPANVFTFGNLLDPNSRVSKMIHDPRTYQVQAYLNTKPAVFYLKRIKQSLEG